MSIMTPHIVSLLFRKTYAPLVRRTMSTMVLVDAVNPKLAELKARAYAKRCYEDLELVDVYVRTVVFVEGVARI